MMDIGWEEAREFNVGGINEFNEFKILFDYENEFLSYYKPCKHAKKKDGHYLIPYVLEMKNEGGYANTTLCLQCAMDAAEIIGLKNAD